MGAPLRTCRNCGFEAGTEEQLGLFVKSKRSKYGRDNSCKVCYNQKYTKTPEARKADRRRHKEMRARRIAQGLCAKCGKTIDQENDQRCIACMKKDRAHWKKSNPRRMERYRERRYDVFQRLTLRDLGEKTPQCAYCRCDEMSVLELNHKKGGGTKEYRKHGGPIRIIDLLYRDKIPLDGYEVTCSVCNIAHYAMMKTGLQWKVTYIQ